MKKLDNIPDIDIVPPLSKEDKEFALRLENETHLPIEALYFVVGQFRLSIENQVNEAAQLNLSIHLDRFYPEIGKSYKKYIKSLLAPNLEIESITVKTNKGTIKLNPSDHLFKSLYISIQRFRKKLDNVINSKRSAFKSGLLDSLLLYLILFFRLNAKLSKFQMRVVIGMFIVHFKVFKGKLIMTEDEFNISSLDLEVQDYKHYLSERVKSRMKKYFPRIKSEFV
jgi:hypothetical protein